MEKMIRTRRDQLQKRGVKGFTLMEMLIVIAIIAVLVAIAIPIFTSQLNKAKASADLANARSIYAVVAASYLSGDSVTVNDEQTTDGTAVTPEITGKTITVNGQNYEFSDQATSLSITTGEKAQVKITSSYSDDYSKTFGTSD